MGTKVHCKSYLPDNYLMRDLNEDSSSSSWPLPYLDKTTTNGQYYSPFVPKPINIDNYPVHGKDALKQKMLEHEAVFKNQVYELHRLYRIQRDMMEEVKRKERNGFRASMEPSSSSSLRVSQLPLEDARKWHVNSPMSCTKAYNITKPDQFPFKNGSSSLKESEPFDSRPLKSRKKLFDLQLPADEYIDTEEDEKAPEKNRVSQPRKLSIGGQVNHVRLADLNEPFRIEETSAPSSVDFLNHSRSNLSSVTHGLQRDKLPIASPTRIHPTGRFWEDPFVASRAPPDPDLFSSSTRFATSWAQSISSWAKPTSSQKITALNPVFLGGKLTAPNGFYHGSASGSKDLHVNCSRVENVASSDRSTNHGLGRFLPKFDSKNAVDIINLNEVAPKSKHEDHLSALPWLKCKPGRGTVTDLNQPFTPKVTSDSSNCEVATKNETAETQSVKKILGFPIFGGALKNEQSHNKERKNIIIDINVELFEADEQIAVEKPSVRDYIDLNSCVSDSEDPSVPSYESKTARVLDIDLEAPFLIENDDDIITPSKEETVGADLSTQFLGNEKELLRDEVLENAAEAILAMSSSCRKAHLPEVSSAESFLWFVDAVLSCPQQEYSEEMDEFEAMTLQLQETREEDYMPRPFVHEVEKIEEGANNNSNNILQTRSRRGQSRRGRQRRDFQRDILPGLASLSRHEVTEDIQTFCGLMQATGHHWVSGLTRRKGSGRGRKRAVVEPVVEIPVCAIEGGGLEDSSLTGWGKTTRRPRRQRCGSGNLSAAAVVLT
ncbi:hypothetical protein ABFS82_12G095700 [Erythranthe guttata]|uniref:uncharacterized protein LOC105967623 n=1 Tax=Erythranthe guttata TaxID=4155 RepID=UPI00064DB200|nr:PREDICTED: uncharacterized protein LOC105967623 [Erythranthe guttata]|eukprot:XP_012847685.1 PREDICTED: uncharacterized protein LOC105967623 [Erythranthe guttata]